MIVGVMKDYNLKMMNLHKIRPIYDCRCDERLKLKLRILHASHTLRTTLGFRESLRGKKNLCYLLRRHTLGFQEKKGVLGPFSGVPRNPKTLLQLWIEVEGQEDRGGREWGERATEKDTLAYLYPDISALLVCQLGRGKGAQLVHTSCK